MSIISKHFSRSQLHLIRLTQLLTKCTQVVFYFLAMIANPIFINTCVVLVRLYWFEKRFQHVVREARNFRRTRSRTKSELRDDLDSGKVERGVDGRNIVVLRNGNIKNPEGEDSIDAENSTSPESESPIISSMSRKELKAELRDRPSDLPSWGSPSFHRDVTFADEIPSIEKIQSSPSRLPQRLSPEEHIAFLENQRNPKDKGTLRIPGPREFDRGDVPVPLDPSDDTVSLHYQASRPVESRGGYPVKRNITIETPDHPHPRSDTGTFSKLTQRRTAVSDQSKITSPTERDPSGRSKTRTGTFGSLTDKNSKEKDPMPYLSWQPTMGRNSAFVDLTEEQREELGGIEYRSLKTLTVILVCELALSKISICILH